MQGFQLDDFSDRYDEAAKFLAQSMKNGALTYKETIHEGFRKIPDAFLGLFSGENIGKQFVKVADPS